MAVKSGIVLAALALGGAWYSGALDKQYARVVDRSPELVMAGLEDLDIRDQPGEPGSTAEAAGGRQPMFRHERTPEGMVWTVMSGNQVAVKMFADLQPVDEGKRTRVTARVERGDAPDDFVSPAFRSKGVTLGLFSMALESELNELTLPKGDPAKCQQLIEDFQMRQPSADMMQQDGLKDAMGDTAAAVVQISAMEAEMRRNGCSTEHKGGFKPVEQRMVR